MSARVGRVFPQQYVGGNRSTPSDKVPTVTPGRARLLTTMLTERADVFTPKEQEWAGELWALLEAHEIDLRNPGDGTPMPYERWAKAFEWLKSINVRAREAAPRGFLEADGVETAPRCLQCGQLDHPGACALRDSVPLIVRELGHAGAMGVYETPDGLFYVVSQSRQNREHTVARRLEEFSGDRLMLSGEHREIRSVVERGAVYRLQPSWKITADRALEFIAVVGRCPRCVGMGLSGRLRDGTSVEMGAGKVCAHQMGFGERYDEAARANYRAKRIAGGHKVRGA